MTTLPRAPRASAVDRNDPANHPALIVRSGETFVVETQLASGPWLTGPEVRWRPGMTTQNNPCVCVAVEGAIAGGVLDVEIVDIQVSRLGYLALNAHEAVLPALAREVFGEVISRTVTITDRIRISDTVSVPLRPMVGTLGTTVAHGSVSHLPGGPWGGNMDVPEIAAGAVVSLPVYVDGALLNVGDVHARQSDLEFAAVETTAEVTLRATARTAGDPLKGPRIVDSTHRSTVGFDDNPRRAFEQAARHLHRWLQEDGLDAEDAYFLMGAAMEARCTRLLDGMNAAYVCKLERSLLEPLGSPS